ncbi:MAG: gamma-glutamyl-gamma-aminobutyrate hydrolase family protein, partial [Pirellulaceae bacterium]
FEAFGGRVIRSGRPIHGRATEIQLVDSPKSTLFEGLPGSCRFARYHSLVCEPSSLPSELRISAWSAEGDVMALEHQTHATFGVQFHPESVLSEHGFQLLENFLRLSGQSVTHRPKPDVTSEELASLQKLSQTLFDGGEHTAVLPRVQGGDS